MNKMKYIENQIKEEKLINDRINNNDLIDEIILNYKDEIISEIDNIFFESIHYNEFYNDSIHNLKSIKIDLKNKILREMINE